MTAVVVNANVNNLSNHKFIQLFSSTFIAVCAYIRQYKIQQYDIKKHDVSVFKALVIIQHLYPSNHSHMLKQY